MGDVVEEGDVSSLHLLSPILGFLSPVLPQQHDLGSLSGKTGLVQ